MYEKLAGVREKLTVELSMANTCPEGKENDGARGIVKKRTRATLRGAVRRKGDERRPELEVYDSRDDERKDEENEPPIGKPRDATQATLVAPPLGPRLGASFGSKVSLATA